ncbi:MAG: enoyl-CoA hydratase-related protein, partial [Promethearchaeota archaeon]
MDYKEIIYDSSNQIATITFNRPDKLNAMTGRMMAEFWDAISRVEDDPNIRVTILTGAGRAFCAGQDLSSGGGTFDGLDKPKEAAKRVEEEGSTIERCFSLKKPIIVAINGPVVGVGITLILPFDIRIASESARIGIVFNRRGVIP